MTNGLDFERPVEGGPRGSPDRVHLDGPHLHGVSAFLFRWSRLGALGSVSRL